VLRSLPERSESKVHFTSARGQGTPVMKSDSRVQMKNVGERIGSLPTLRQPGKNIEVRIAG